MKQRLLYLALCAAILTALTSQAESWEDSNASPWSASNRTEAGAAAWLQRPLTGEALAEAKALRVSPALPLSAAAVSSPARSASQPSAAASTPTTMAPTLVAAPVEQISLWARLQTWVSFDTGASSSPASKPTTVTSLARTASPGSQPNRSMRASGSQMSMGTPGPAPTTLCHGPADANAVSTNLVTAVGSDVSVLDKQVAASAAHALLSRYKSSLGIQSTIGLNGLDRVAICLSNSASPVVAAGGYQGLVLVPLSTHLAAGRTQSQWQQAMAHELVKVVQAQLSLDTQDRHLLPRWFQEGMAAYLAQEAYLDSTDKVSAWVSQYNSSGQCGPLDIAAMSDLQRCSVQQESSTYGPAYASVMHLLFDATSSGGAGASVSLLSSVLSDMASGSTFAASFTNHLGWAASTGWHLQVLTPGY